MVPHAHLVGSRPKGKGFNGALLFVVWAAVLEKGAPISLFEEMVLFFTGFLNWLYLFYFVCLTVTCIDTTEQIQIALRQEDRGVGSSYTDFIAQENVSGKLVLVLSACLTLGAW